MKLTTVVSLFLLGMVAASEVDLEAAKKKSKSKKPSYKKSKLVKPIQPECPKYPPKKPSCSCHDELHLLGEILDALTPPCRCGRHSSSDKLCDVVLANGYTNVFASSSLARSYANNAQNG